MKFKSFFTGLVATVVVTTAPMAALAQSSSFGSKYLNQVGQKSEVSGLARANIYDVVARLINIIISLLGTVLLGYLLFAGYLWMTAQGDDKQVQRAKDMIKNAIIGLVIVAAAFAITNFVLGRLSCVIGTGESCLSSTTAT